MKATALLVLSAVIHSILDLNDDAPKDHILPSLVRGSHLQIDTTMSMYVNSIS